MSAEASLIKGRPGGVLDTWPRCRPAKRALRILNGGLACAAESEEEQDIHYALELNGLDQFCVTACYRIHSHIDTKALTGKTRSYPPWKD